MIPIGKMFKVKILAYLSVVKANLNMRRVIVSGRVALLPWSTEIQPYVSPIRPSPLSPTVALRFEPLRNAPGLPPRPFNESVGRDPGPLIATTPMPCLKNMVKAWKLGSLTKTRDMMQNNTRCFLWLTLDSL